MTSISPDHLGVMSPGAGLPREATIGALTLLFGQTELTEFHRDSGVLISPDETYTDLHLNSRALHLQGSHAQDVAERAAGNLRFVKQSLGEAARYIRDNQAPDAVVLGMSYGRLIHAARLFGFRTVSPPWGKLPSGYVKKLMSWETEAAPARVRRAYTNGMPRIATAYLRTNDFVGLFAEE